MILNLFDLISSGSVYNYKKFSPYTDH